jgi:hypothetical protein
MSNVKEMKKYYIKSGSLRVVILASDERKAIIQALEFATDLEGREDLEIDDYFYVNEQGFDSMDEDTFTMDTEEVIEILLGWEWEE